MPRAIAFTRLRREDFPLVARWLAEPAVARWWNQDASLEAVEREYGASVDGREPTDLFLAAAGGQPFGLIQRYAIASYTEYLEELSAICEVPAGALSVDYLIGEPDHRGRGLGAGMIAALAARSWEELPHAHDVIVPVAAGNTASWRALERAGFERIAVGELEPDNPIDPRDHVIYRLRRPGYHPVA